MSVEVIQESDFTIKSLKFMYFYAKAFGAVCFAVQDNGRLKRSFKSHIFCISFRLFCFITFLVFLPHVLKTTLEKQHEHIKMVVWVQLSSLLCFSVVFLILQAFHRDKFIKLANKTLDVLLRMSLMTKDSRLFGKELYAMIAGRIVFNITLLIADISTIFEAIKKDNIALAIEVILFYILWFGIMAMVDIICLGYLTAAGMYGNIGNHMRSLAKRIEVSEDFSTTKYREMKSLCEFSEELDECSVIYSQVFQLTQEFQQLFQFYMFFMVYISFLIIVTSIHELFFAYLANGEIMWNVLAACIVQIISFLFVMFLVDLVMRQSKIPKYLDLDLMCSDLERRWDRSSQNAIGRHRNFPKTSFTCTDRPAGYYADIETGCQVYHMCDGLGRQFSYSCPNTTLFQQRMLICDHWYMVNCSKAEMDYTANLLIGQRDKPFVPDEENHLRTPRPDLLDRPYAPDYSGESFRNQFKQLSPIQNSITDGDQRKNNNDKSFSINHPSPTPTRWKIPQPSREILPPAPPLPDATTRSPLVVASPAPRPQITLAPPFIHTTQTPEPFVQRQQETSDENSDLGTAHSTRYNTTGDNSAEDRHAKIPTKPPAVKTPSRIYEPPFLYPIYNQDDDDVPLTEVPLQSSTAAPFTASFASSASTTGTTTTTRSPTRPTTVAGKPFAVSSPAESTTAAAFKVAESTDSALDYNIPSAGSKSFPLPSPFSPPKTALNDLKAPSRELLPPLSDIVLHDTATTQGPPIYFEWKIPSNGLEPPKFDSPIGVDGREEQDAPLSYIADQVKSASTTTTAKSISSQQYAGNPFLPNKTQQYTGNPFLSNKTQRSIDSSTSRTPTSRSIKNFPSQGTDENKLTPTLPTEHDIQQLRMDFSVPDYLFPLENIGRTGYEHSDTLNSFQLKIPHRRVDLNVDAPSAERWYGENPKCPECHPSFVKPGTCEPCLRR